MDSEQRKAFKIVLTIVTVITCIFFIVSLLTGNWHYLIYSILSMSFMVSIIALVFQNRGKAR